MTDSNQALAAGKRADHPRAGYVPPFGDADGQEDPAPEPVVTGVAMPGADAGGAPRPDEHAADGRPPVVPEVRPDPLSDPGRRVGPMPKAPDVPSKKEADPTTAVVPTLRTPDAS